MISKLKKIIFVVSTNMVGIVVVLVSAEIVLRLIGFGFTLYPTKVQFGWPNPILIKHLYQVDPEILWVSKDYYSKVATWKSNRPSIVFMGDSCTEFGRYDKFLESIISDDHPNSNFTFVNMGVGGYSSYQGLKQLTRDILPMRPSVVIVYYGWNDHWRSYGIEDKAIGKFNLEHPTLLLKMSKSRVVQLINRAIYVLKQPDTEMNGRMPERVSISDYVYNLTKMVQIMRNKSIIPVLLTAPSSHRKGAEPAYLATRWLNDLDDLVPIHEKYVKAVRDVSSKEHVLLIDLYAEFRKLPVEELTNLFSKDGIHLTEEGNKKIAVLIYEYFQKNGLIHRLIGAD